MANNFQPIPQDTIAENFKWRDWFRSVSSWIRSTGSMALQESNAVNITGGSIKDTSINLPFGSFSSTATQSVSVINTPTRVAFNTTDFANYTNFVSGDGIHVSKSGLYNVQFSIQVTNADNTSHDMAIWLRHGVYGGSIVDIPWSNSVTSVVGTHGGQPGYGVMAANFFVRLQATDYIEFWWSTNSLQVQLQALPAITTPFVSPGAPSIVTTLTYISS